MPPEEIVVQLDRAVGALKLATWQPCGFTPENTCLIAPSFPAASIAWKMHSTDPAVLRVEHVLQLREPLHAVLQQLRRVVLVEVEPGGVARVVVLQPEALALRPRGSAPAILSRAASRSIAMPSPLFRRCGRRRRGASQNQPTVSACNGQRQPSAQE